MATQKKPKLAPPGGNLSLLLIFALGITGLYTIFNGNVEGSYQEVPISEFVQDIKAEQVESIEVKSNRIDYIQFEYDEEEQVVEGSEINKFAIKEFGVSVSELLKDIDPMLVDNLEIEIIDTTKGAIWKSLALSLIPIFLLIGFFWFMIASKNGGGNQAMSFGKSSARVHNKEESKTTFKDVAGVQEAKEELVEVVDFLKNPSKYTAMGAKIPKGVMLVGAPGTGKTLLARAVAGEANVPFFSISGSEFVEMFVGVGASRVRDLFKKAKRNSPCIIFIDEIDAVGRKRGAGLGGGNDEREQTLNQILTEMDGFENSTTVIIIAATNRPDVLDPALLRPGRFDRSVMVDKPTKDGREEILKIHTKNKPLAKDADLSTLAHMTPGLTGADLENLVNEAAISAARDNKKEITGHELEMAFEKVALGRERKSLVMTDEQKLKTAYHEMGHAVIGHVLDGCDPIQKVTIIPRGMALGVTWSRPAKDEVSRSKIQMEHRMAMALGGYVAEEMIYGRENLTTGPGSDLQKVAQIARDMVTRYGMSPLGPLTIGSQNNEVFIGRDFGHTKNYSEDMAAKVDAEIHKIVQKAHKHAEELLTKHKKKFVEMSKLLLEKESFSFDEFIEHFDGKKPEKKTDKKSPSKSISKSKKQNSKGSNKGKKKK
jgi:cell division protease FtsH